MNLIKIKPLTVNQAWQGKRFKTQKYKDYEKELGYLLPKLKIDKRSDLEILITWGLSNSASDIDNPTKPFLDVLQKVYDFNDKNIMSLVLKKKKVDKGQEFIAFSVIELMNTRSY